MCRSRLHQPESGRAARRPESSDTQAPDRASSHPSIVRTNELCCCCCNKVIDSLTSSTVAFRRPSSQLTASGVALFPFFPFDIETRTLRDPPLLVSIATSGHVIQFDLCTCENRKWRCCEREKCIVRRHLKRPRDQYSVTRARHGLQKLSASCSVRWRLRSGRGSLSALLSQPRLGLLGSRLHRLWRRAALAASRGRLTDVPRPPHLLQPATEAPTNEVRLGKHGDEEISPSRVCPATQADAVGAPCPPQTGVPHEKDCVCWGALLPDVPSHPRQSNVRDLGSRR